MSNEKKSFLSLNTTLKTIGIILIGISISRYFNKNFFASNTGLKLHELIQKDGYPLEIHTVVTEDGYILTLHRIPSKFKRKKNKYTIFLQPGTVNSAADFIVQGPKKALAYKLADEGFDVWMGNSRGTTWSRKHQILNPDIDRQKFFNFSFHEMGIYDLPACIDYILEKTENKQLYFIGYSQGVSSFFAMASERPDYLKKVKLVSALAPYVIVKSSISLFKYMLPKPILYLIDIVFNLIDLHEMVPTDGYFALYMKTICNENSFLVDLCIFQVSLLHGYNPKQINKTFLNTIYQNVPAGASRKQLVHLDQLFNSGKFQKFDYGHETNLKVYGQTEPPEYKLNKVTVPVAIYYAQNDYLISTNDIQVLKRNLPFVIKDYLVPLRKFNHGDFLYAKDADKLLYNEIINTIKYGK